MLAKRQFTIRWETLQDSVLQNLDTASNIIPWVLKEFNIPTNKGPLHIYYCDLKMSRGIPVMKAFCKIGPDWLAVCPIAWWEGQKPHNCCWSQMGARTGTGSHIGKSVSDGWSTVRPTYRSSQYLNAKT